jgi:hypothetical protein
MIMAQYLLNHKLSATFQKKKGKFTVNHINRLKGLITLLGSLALILWASQAAAIMVSLDESQDAAPGQQVTLVLSVSDAGDDSLAGYGLTVLYDTRYLTIDSQSFTSQDCLPDCAYHLPLDITNDGEIYLGEVIYDDSIYGSQPYELATLTFSVVDSITAALTTEVSILTTSVVYYRHVDFINNADRIFSNNISNREVSNATINILGQDTNVSSQNTPGEPNIATIPEPAPLALLGLGLAGIFFTRRQTKT